MDGLDLVSLLGQSLAHLFGDHYRTVLAASAAKGYREVALSFFNVVWQQKQQQLRDAIQELCCLGELADVLGHLGMAAGQMPELRHEVRIGQEPDVENQVGFERYTVLIAKTDGRDHQILVRTAALKLLQDVSAQLMDLSLIHI